LGGSEPAVLTEEMSKTTNADIQKAQTAQHSTENALEIAQAQLQAEHNHANDLYKDLRLERQKASRNKASKAQAQAHLADAQKDIEQLEEKLEQLTLKNEQLETTMSQLLEN
jgi:predicted RNase H-like nuclease (RuvC/YqgF family)